MRVLTVKQPWAWAIVSGLKDVENRTWKTPHRGLIAIHAGLTHDPAGELALRGHGYSDGAARIDRGAIIGLVRLVDCIQGSTSPWAHPGSWHWLLSDPVMLDEPVVCRGQMGLFRASADVADDLADAARQIA